MVLGLFLTTESAFFYSLGGAANQMPYFSADMLQLEPNLMCLLFKILNLMLRLIFLKLSRCTLANWLIPFFPTPISPSKSFLRCLRGCLAPLVAPQTCLEGWIELKASAIQLLTGDYSVFRKLPLPLRKFQMAITLPAISGHQMGIYQTVANFSRVLANSRMAYESPSLVCMS
jgi:hypothetical protein